jgi:hypothetical protein
MSRNIHSSGNVARSLDRNVLSISRFSTDRRKALVAGINLPEELPWDICGVRQKKRNALCQFVPMCPMAAASCSGIRGKVSTAVYSTVSGQVTPQSQAVSPRRAACQHMNWQTNGMLSGVLACDLHRRQPTYMMGVRGRRVSSTTSSLKTTILPTYSVWNMHCTWIDFSEYSGGLERRRLVLSRLRKNGAKALPAPASGSQRLVYRTKVSR